MSISQGQATTPAPVSSRYRMPTAGDFRPQPEGGEASSFDSRLAASPPGGTGRAAQPLAAALLAGARDARRRKTPAGFTHGIAIDRLVGVKHTAASAVW